MTPGEEVEKAEAVEPATSASAPASEPGVSDAETAEDQRTFFQTLSPEAAKRYRRARGRKHDVPASTIGWRYLHKIVRKERATFGELPRSLPLLRSDCQNTPRPCPFVSCRHHLYLDATDTGGVKLNFPDLEVWDLKESCSLDIADRGGTTLERVGEIMNITRERIRQVEVRLLDRVREAGPLLEEYVGDETIGPLSPLGGNAIRQTEVMRVSTDDEVEAMVKILRALGDEETNPSDILQREREFLAEASPEALHRYRTL